MCYLRLVQLINQCITITQKDFQHYRNKKNTDAARSRLYHLRRKVKPVNNGKEIYKCNFYLVQYLNFTSFSVQATKQVTMNLESIDVQNLSLSISHY